MMLDRKTDFITAVLTSLTAVRANPWESWCLWAALIAIFTGIGLMTFYLGLAIVLPLIGHATPGMPIGMWWTAAPLNSTHSESARRPG
jgi:uncharacterized membrane protein